LAGKTWWSCGESVAEAIANRPRKACRLFAHLQIFENLMQMGKSHTPAEEVNSALAQVLG
jgi:hypothetical protein